MVARPCWTVGCHQTTSRSSRSSVDLSGILDTTTVYWVTDPMAHVAMEAAHSIPDINPDQDMPSPTGLMGFEKPLPPLPSPVVKKRGAEEEDLPVSALFWYTEGEFLAVCVFTWTGHLPEYAKPEVGKLVVPLLESFTLRVPRHQTQRIDDLQYSTAEKSLLAFLSTTWIQMMTPKLVETKRIDTRTGGLVGPGAEDHVPSVTTITLRPLRHTEVVERDPESGRTYKHTWVVRGHWRDQAYGVGHSLRRPTWIPAYIKGPEGAPLRASEKVMVWRR